LKARGTEGEGEDGAVVLFWWSGEAREVNSSAAVLGRENGDGVRLETSSGGGPKCRVA
jgi:hypothetical protein